MSRQTINLTHDLHEYLLSVSVREPGILRRLREETAQLPMANMQVSPEQGQLMALLVELIQARNILEVGTFTGYSALAMALAMQGEGNIVCCDVSDEWTSIARRYWREAGVDHQIGLYLAPAGETLQSLVDKGQSGRFDLAFIDADKENYLQYFEYCLQLLRPGGLIMVDNTLWGGSVIDSGNQTASTRAIRKFNEHVFNDERVSVSLVPMGDGLTLARKL